MCFRPTEMSMNECPQCGAKNKPIATECAQCGAPLEQKRIDFDADQAKLDAFVADINIRTADESSHLALWFPAK